jgi:hypothetical protein
MKNSEILNAPKSLLGAVEQQRKFILQMQGQKMPCPNCGHCLNVFEALGVELDDYDTGSTTDGKTACTSCKRALRYAVPVFVVGPPWHWALVPIAPSPDA